MRQTQQTFGASHVEAIFCHRKNAAMLSLLCRGALERLQYVCSNALPKFSRISSGFAGPVQTPSRRSKVNKTVMPFVHLVIKIKSYTYISPVWMNFLELLSAAKWCKMYVCWQKSYTNESNWKADPSVMASRLSLEWSGTVWNSLQVQKKTRLGNLVKSCLKSECLLAFEALQKKISTLASALQSANFTNLKAVHPPNGLRRPKERLFTFQIFNCFKSL